MVVKADVFLDQGGNLIKVANIYGKARVKICSQIAVNRLRNQPFAAAPSQVIKTFIE